MMIIVMLKAPITGCIAQILVINKINQILKMRIYLSSLRTFKPMYSCIYRVILFIKNFSIPPTWLVSNVTAWQAVAPGSILASCQFFRGKIISLFHADSRAGYQLLAKEWALKTGKLPLEGLPRNSVAK